MPTKKYGCKPIGCWDDTEKKLEDDDDDDARTNVGLYLMTKEEGDTVDFFPFSLSLWLRSLSLSLSQVNVLYEIHAQVEEEGREGGGRNKKRKGGGGDGRGCLCTRSEKSPLQWTRCSRERFFKQPQQMNDFLPMNPIKKMGYKN